MHSFIKKKKAYTLLETVTNIRIHFWNKNTKPSRLNAVAVLTKFPR